MHLRVLHLKYADPPEHVVRGRLDAGGAGPIDGLDGLDGAERQLVRPHLDDRPILLVKLVDRLGSRAREVHEQDPPARELGQEGARDAGREPG